jgi:hypothetical protein
MRSRPITYFRKNCTADSLTDSDSDSTTSPRPYRCTAPESSSATSTAYSCERFCVVFCREAWLCPLVRRSQSLRKVSLVHNIACIFYGRLLTAPAFPRLIYTVLYDGMERYGLIAPFVVLQKHLNHLHGFGNQGLISLFLRFPFGLTPKQSPSVKSPLHARAEGR